MTWPGKERGIEGDDYAGQRKAAIDDAAAEFDAAFADGIGEAYLKGYELDRRCLRRDRPMEAKPWPMMLPKRQQTQ